MSEHLRTPEDYELFLYTLSERFTSVRRSTITLVRRGMTLARVAGEIEFDQGVRLVVRERLVYARMPIAIEGYGYEVWRGNEKLYWYDSQPHPDDPTLMSTHPHHKHTPPDMKHHRVPAPDLSFTEPSLAFLIQEIEQLLER